MKQTWRQQAACRGLDPMIFYPVTDEEAEDAKDVCFLVEEHQATVGAVEVGSERFPSLPCRGNAPAHAVFLRRGTSRPATLQRGL